MPRGPRINGRAIARLEAACDAVVDAVNALDDYSRETLQAPQGFSAATARETARKWSDTATAALQRLDGRESRGRVPEHARRVLLALLVDVFRREGRRGTRRPRRVPPVRVPRGRRAAVGYAGASRGESIPS
jgi:hypothetical protein